MLPQLFDYESGVVKPTIHCYTLAPIKKIMDTVEDPIKILQYLYYMTYPDFARNPFMETAEDDRETEILKGIDADFDPEEPIIIDALVFCRERMRTIKYRAWEGQKVAYENLITFLKNTKPTAGKDGSAPEIRAVMKDMPAMSKAYHEAFKELQEETNTRVRGAINLAYDQE